jgi:hypothetical protein
MFVGAFKHDRCSQGRYFCVSKLVTQNITEKSLVKHSPKVNLIIILMCSSNKPTIATKVACDKSLSPL